MLTGMYADAALSTGDQPAGPVLGYMRVGQLALPVIIRLARLCVEAHFRDEWLGKLAAAWTIHQRPAGIPTAGLRLRVGKKRRLVLGISDGCFPQLELSNTHSRLVIKRCTMVLTNYILQ